MMPLSVLDQFKMWSNDERVLLEQELLRLSQERAYIGGTGNRGVINPLSLQGQLAFDNELRMFRTHQQMILPSRSGSIQTASSLLFPSNSSTISMGFQNSLGMLEAISPSAYSLDSRHLELLRLLRLRSEREQLERDLIINEQLEEARHQEISMRRSLATTTNPGTPDVASHVNLQVNKEDTSVRTVSRLQKQHTSKEMKPQARKSKKIGSSSEKPLKKDTKWLSMLEELKKYKQENGDTIVPRGYVQNTKLASWVAEQRKQYKLLQDNKQSSITQSRVDLLNELGFAWNAQEAAWSRHLNDLRRFRSETGHCHVPLNHPTYPKLGLWVKEQRRHYTLMKQGKPSHITTERCDELNSLGFCYDTHESTWQERLRELADFRDEYGSCSVPCNYFNTKLATWVHHQRRQYKKFKQALPCHITEERIKALDKLGFIWYPRQLATDGNDDSSSSGDDDSSETSTDTEEKSSTSCDIHVVKRQRRA